MALNAANFNTVCRLLDEALALPKAAHAAWLQSLPAEHQRHAQTLRDGLASDAMLDLWLTLEADESVAHAQDRIGPYRLLRETGHGGMGSAWLAERARAVKEFVVDVFKLNAADNSTEAELRKLPAELLVDHGAHAVGQNPVANRPHARGGKRADIG
jgi:hypothetical protein